jgi:hypothetical protein
MRSEQVVRHGRPVPTPLCSPCPFRRVNSNVKAQRKRHMEPTEEEAYLAMFHLLERHAMGF